MFSSKEREAAEAQEELERKMEEASEREEETRRLQKELEEAKRDVKEREKALVKAEHANPSAVKKQEQNHLQQKKVVVIANGSDHSDDSDTEKDGESKHRTKHLLYYSNDFMIVSGKRRPLQKKICVS